MKLGDEEARPQLITLTPLIDVVFILLIFFMLASSFLDWRGVDLRLSTPGGGAPSAENSLLVQIKSDGSLSLDGKVLGEAELEARIGERLSEAPDKGIVLRPDPGVTLQRSVDVLDLLKRAGAVNLSLSRQR